LGLQQTMIHEWRMQFPVNALGNHVLCSGEAAPVTLPTSVAGEHFSFAFLCTHEHGMVYIHADNQRAIVNWDLQRCHPGALDRAREWLMDNHTGQVILRFRYLGLRIEKFDSVTVSVDRMGKLDWYRDVPKGEQVAISNNTDSYSNTAAIQRGFEIADRACDIGEMGALLPYLLVWSQCEDTGHLIREHAGRNSGAAIFFGSEWQRTAAGEAYDGETQGEYFSERVSANYLPVLYSGIPIVDHVYGLAFNDLEGGVWLPYQRLLFQTHLVDGRPALACLTDLTENITIPMLPTPVANLMQ